MYYMPTKQIIHNVDDIQVIEYEKSSIYIIENILNIAFCDEVKMCIDQLPLNKLFHSDGNNVECNISYIDELLKLNDELYYSFTTDTDKYHDQLNKLQQKQCFYTNQINGISKKTIENYKNHIDATIIKIKNAMVYINKNIKFDCNSGYILRKIYGSTRLHIDSINEVYETNLNFIKENNKGEYKMVRNSSIIFGLNDDYDGGLYNFPYYDITIRLKKGSVIIFPPYWTHEHQVFGVENNTYRYTISTWNCMNII